MARVDYRKLVRNRIPEIIAADGGHPVTGTLDEAGFRDALLAKLVEEANEARAAPSAALAGELADVFEVLLALTSAIGLSWDDIVTLADRKRADRGGFSDRVFLEYVE